MQQVALTPCPLLGDSEDFGGERPRSEEKEDEGNDEEGFDSNASGQ